MSSDQPERTLQIRYVKETVSPNLRADRLSLLHTLPHPQLDFMPQSSELQHTGDDRFK